MSYSKSQHGEEARKSLIKGAEQVYKPVSTTLGPRGRNVVLGRSHFARVIHDGVKTANEVNPKDPFENTGAEIVKEAGQRQVDIVGDGTTVAIVLGYSIAKEALKLVNSGINPMSLRSSLEKGRDILIKRIEKLAKPISTREEKIQIATVSSEDELLGNLIGDTYHKAGVDAIVTAEQITGSHTFIDHQEGMQIDSGWKNEWFITNPNSRTATVTKAKVLVTDYKLDNIHDLVPLINDLVQKGERNLVVIADDIDGNVLATLIGNKVKGNLNCIAIKAPSYHMESVLRDIAANVGAKFISSKAKMDLKKIKTEDLGYANRVTSTKDATVIVEGGGNPKDIKDTISSIKNQIKDEKNEFNKEKLKERLAKLTGGVYVVKVGGITEKEAEEKYERADDAIKATRAAIHGGVVAGGETIYLKVRDLLKPNKNSENEDYAFRILRNALEKPFNKLVENAGFDPGEMRMRLSIEDSKSKENLGFDVTTGELVNMFEKGIIDPAMVSIEAIKNGIAVAISIITSDAIVCEIRDEEKK